MSNISLLFVGDLILDEPDPDPLFDSARSVLQSADILVGHVEVPHTTEKFETTIEVPAPPSDPRNLLALGRAGFDVATLAGNHMYDCGPAGIRDTIAALRAQGIATTGAGMNLAEARTPAIIERNGKRFGFLSYNCVGPRESWAGPKKPGCAYIKVLTHYETEYASVGAPPKVYTFAEHETVEAMQEDVANLREQVDVVSVSFHKGVGHTPATVATYERQVAKAAIDAGADIVVGHHAHILAGVETYKGKPIFHGLGNFVTVTRALNMETNPSPERLEWAKRRKKKFGFAPDPLYPNYPFHPEARNTMIASCIVTEDKPNAIDAGFLPCYVQPTGAPELLGHDARGIEVADYVQHITRESGLRAQFNWEGNRVVFR